MKLLGDGIAIMPSSNKVYSPCTGFVSVIYPSQHAILIESDNGDEVMMYIGIDSSHLDRNVIRLLIKANDRVEKGKLIGFYNYTKVKNNTVFLVITNLTDNIFLEKKNIKSVKSGDIILQIKEKKYEI